MANIAAAYPANEMGVVSQLILRLSVDQAHAVSTNGWQTMQDFEGYSTQELKTWVKQASRTPTLGQGVLPTYITAFSTTQTRRLCGLAHWVNRRILRGAPLLPLEFDEQAM